MMVPAISMARFNRRVCLRVVSVAGPSGFSPVYHVQTPVLHEARALLSQPSVGERHAPERTSSVLHIEHKVRGIASAHPLTRTLLDTLSVEASRYVHNPAIQPWVGYFTAAFCFDKHGSLPID